MAGSIGKFASYSVSFQRFGRNVYALSKAMWGDARADGGYHLPQYDNWVNSFVNYNTGIGCHYGYIIPANIAFHFTDGHYEIGVSNGNQLCRITGNATGQPILHNAQYNHAVLNATKRELQTEKYYLDIYNQFQKDYKGFKYLIHDDDKLQKYFVVVENDNVNTDLQVRKIDLINKTDEAYLSYSNYNLIAMIENAKKEYPLLDKQIQQLENLVLNNQAISVIEANELLYNNEIFIKNYLVI